MRQGRWFGFLLAFALVATACGGGSDDEGSATTAGGTDSATTTTTESSERVSGDSDSDWCRQAREVAAGEEDSPLQFDFLQAGSGDLEKLFKDNQDAYAEIARLAPSEIKDDVDFFRGVFDSMIQMGDAAGWNLATMANDPAFIETFSDPDLEAAANRIDQYTQDVCGVDFGAEFGADVPGPGDVPGPDFGDDGVATEILELLFLPRSAVSDAQVECLNTEVGAQYPDGLPDDLLRDPALFDVLNAAVETCGLIPGG